MKAFAYRKYGPPEVLKMIETDRPAIAADEVLVEVRATSVTTADWRLRASAFPGALWLPGRLMFGLLRPRKQVLGGDFAGRVAAVGADVRDFKPGDAAFGFSGLGAHAEYLAIKADGAIAAMPAGLSFEDAAALPFGALSALVFLRDFGRLRPGARVLIVGASGGVGAYAVQIARHMGAEVAGVCSAANMGLVRDLGAMHVTDYAVEDFTRSGRRHDLILDTVGAADFATCRKALTPEGVFLPLNFGLREMFQALASAIRGGQRVAIGVSGDSKADLEHLKSMLASGALRPVIDRRFAFADIAAAHRHVERRHRRGAVVIPLSAA